MMEGGFRNLDRLNIFYLDFVVPFWDDDAPFLCLRESNSYFVFPILWVFALGLCDVM